MTYPPVEPAAERRRARQQVEFAIGKLTGDASRPPGSVGKRIGGFAAVLSSEKYTHKASPSREETRFLTYPPVEPAAERRV